MSDLDFTIHQITPEPVGCVHAPSPQGMRELERKGTMIRTLMFETPNDRGFVFRVWDLNDGKGNAFIEVERDSVLIRSFQFPAYKVWNIAAHAKDIINSELLNGVDGYLMAGSDGLGGNVFKREGT